MSIVKKFCCCCFSVSDRESGLHSCPSINPSGRQVSYQSLSNDSESSGEAIVSLDTRPSTPSSERRRSHLRLSLSTDAGSQHSVYKRNRKRCMVVDGGDCPKLECIVIPSFGKCPPHIVAVKKSSSDFLEGVGDDLEKIQTMIGDDDDKELSRVELMCHFKQIKIKVFETKIKSRMEDIKLSRNRTSACQKGCKYMYVVFLFKFSRLGTFM